MNGDRDLMASFLSQGDQPVLKVDIFPGEESLAVFMHQGHRS